MFALHAFSERSINHPGERKKVPLEVLAYFFLPFVIVADGKSEFSSIFSLFLNCLCFANRIVGEIEKKESAKNTVPYVDEKRASSHILKSTIVETKIKKWIFHEDKRAENSIKFFSPHLVCLLDFFDSKKERSGKMKKKGKTRNFSDKRAVEDENQ